MNRRGSGILIHITSLHTRFGIGDLGPVASDFVRYLAEAGQKYWQILPIHPTEPEYDNSPYHAISAFAFNPLLISPERMILDGFLKEQDLYPIPDFPQDSVDFVRVIEYKERLFILAYERFKEEKAQFVFDSFCSKNSWWLDDYALFTYLRKKYHPKRWDEWPENVKKRYPDALLQAAHEGEKEIEKEKFLQFLFHLQWERLREECKVMGITLIGDIPIYIDHDSADVWTFPGLFKLGTDLKPTVISGVPPDYFSSTGQVWNNPIYNWEMMKHDNYSWWSSRIEHLIRFVDYLRIDHFRGLVGFWEIPAGETTAVNGRWVDAPARDLLKNLVRKFPYLPIIAEDLGIITPDVREIIHEFSIPGMKVLLFAFENGMADNPYILHNISKNAIVYTGTHDNNPIQGWFSQDASEVEKKNLSAYLGREITQGSVNLALIRMAMMSVANTVILPVQDLLGLDAKARMNCPGTDKNNWRWKLIEGQLSGDSCHLLKELTEIYGRQ